MKGTYLGISNIQQKMGQLVSDLWSKNLTDSKDYTRLLPTLCKFWFSFIEIFYISLRWNDKYCLSHKTTDWFLIFIFVSICGLILCFLWTFPWDRSGGEHLTGPGHIAIALSEAEFDSRYPVSNIPVRTVGLPWCWQYPKLCLGKKRFSGVLLCDYLFSWNKWGCSMSYYRYPNMQPSAFQLWYAQSLLNKSGVKLLHLFISGRETLLATS